MSNVAADESPGLKAWGILIILSIIWGSSFILIKVGLKELSPIQVGALRVTSAGIFLIPWVIKGIKNVKKRHLGWLFIIGFMGSFFPAFLFAKAQTSIDSSLAGVLNALTPLWVIIVGALFFVQKFTKDVIIGVIIGFLGTALLVLTGSDGIRLNWYAGYIILATICYGFNLNIIKFKMSDLKPATITGTSLVMVLPIALATLLFDKEFEIVQSHDMMMSLGAIILLGVMGTAIALVMFNGLVQITSPVFTSSVTYLIPIVAVMWGILDGEELLIGHYLGMLLILFGVFIANRRK